MVLCLRFLGSERLVDTQHTMKQKLRDKFVGEGMSSRSVIYCIGKSCGLCRKYQESDDKTIAVLLCGRSFHRDCFTEWQKRGVKCPHCYQDMIEIEGNN
ncbi:MAG: hypothetical protein EZS28_013871 [Streblomastix strix]|uniref:RING-type domain-containing protein n=1 Tax=Streblomastix strix TaxID=222440 RepID=A0A5J4W6M7_9EUKA|nr:MAG: hypothetical protein EZS28_013871 [Streblomastix strix]